MADGFASQVDATPVAPQRPQEGDLVSRAVAARLALEAALEAALAVLDAMDTDPDLEPSLGSLSDQAQWTAGGDDDREGDEHDGREPPEDDEWSLGWAEGESRRGRFLSCDPAAWSSDEGEPSLGSIGCTDQRRWAGGQRATRADLDREEQCEDEGAQCDDEGAQCDDEGHDSDREPDVDAELSLGWGAPDTWNDPHVLVVGRRGVPAFAYAADNDQ